MSCAPKLDITSDTRLDLRIACPPPPKRTRAAGCSRTVRMRLPRVRGGRVTQAVVRHGKRRLLRRRGRDLRTLRVRRASPKAHRLRVELRTTKGSITLTRRVAACGRAG